MNLIVRGWIETGYEMRSREEGGEVSCRRAVLNLVRSRKIPTDRRFHPASERLQWPLYR